MSNPAEDIPVDVTIAAINLMTLDVTSPLASALAQAAKDAYAKGYQAGKRDARDAINADALGQHWRYVLEVSSTLQKAALVAKKLDQLYAAATKRPKRSRKR